jgi:hypothetical protein
MASDNTNCPKDEVIGHFTLSPKESTYINAAKYDQVASLPGSKKDEKAYAYLFAQLVWVNEVRLQQLAAAALVATKASAVDADKAVITALADLAAKQKCHSQTSHHDHIPVRKAFMNMRGAVDVLDNAIAYAATANADAVAAAHKSENSDYKAEAAAVNLASSKARYDNHHTP